MLGQCQQIPDEAPGAQPGNESKTDDNDGM